MKILHLHPGPDTGGQSMAGKRVLEASGDEVRVFTRTQHIFGYEAAQPWDQELVQDSYEWADVVIVHNEPTLLERVATGSPKELIVHHHGSRFRSNPGLLWAAGEAIGARQIVSTVDLLNSVPVGKHADWMPQVVDVERMERLRLAYEPPGNRRLRIAHAPTNKAIKGTRHVLKASRRLRGKADLVLIQRQPWWVCLMWKATSDIFIDQLILGYGNNAIEAWAMGLPVLSGASDAVIETMLREYDGVIPFFRTTPDLLTRDLDRFIDSAELREEWAARGRAHIDRFHVPDAWAARTRRLYAGDAVLMAA